MRSIDLSRVASIAPACSKESSECSRKLAMRQRCGAAAYCPGRPLLFMLCCYVMYVYLCYFMSTPNLACREHRVLQKVVLFSIFYANLQSNHTVQIANKLWCRCRRLLQAVTK